MWVVKIGGSLSRDPLLPQWLALIAQLGGGRVAIVPGGGGFADEVRRAQAHSGFDDLAAHNMAVLAMAQTAYQWQALHPALQLAGSEADIRRVLRRGQAALWLPLEMQRERADATTTWDRSADSMALALAARLNAERLVVVKSCALDDTLSFMQLAEAGIVDRGFPALARDAGFPIDLVERGELDRLRALLLGEVRVA